MKKIFFMTALLLSIGCSPGFVGSKFELIKKHPKEIFDLNLNIINDSVAVVYKHDDIKISQKIIFFKKDKNFLVVKYLEDKNKLIEYELGDTILFYKNSLHFSNDKIRLLFKKVQNFGDVPN